MIKKLNMDELRFIHLLENQVTIQHVPTGIIAECGLYASMRSNARNCEARLANAVSRHYQTTGDVNMKGNLKGRQVVYQKPRSSRYGWRGEVIEDTGHRVTIAYHNCGVVQSYRRDALTEKSMDECDLYAYIRVLPLDEHNDDIVDFDAYVVAGERGGAPIRCGTLAEAQDVANKRAEKSKSGQAYIIYGAFESYQRSTPPVEKKRIVTPNDPEQ